jgi:hypothetical protein
MWISVYQRPAGARNVLIVGTARLPIKTPNSTIDVALVKSAVATGDCLGARISIYQYPAGAWNVLISGTAQRTCTPSSPNLSVNVALNWNCFRDYNIACARISVYQRPAGA